jgi:hypothetical protein
MLRFGRQLCAITWGLWQEDLGDVQLTWRRERPVDAGERQRSSVARSAGECRRAAGWRVLFGNPIGADA